MRLSRFFLVLWLLGYAVLPAVGHAHPEMRVEDRVRIREAMNISKLLGDSIWKGISETPFTLILVTDSVEFLINHPSPPSDFTLLGYDSILSSIVYSRRTTFNKHFLATFPAIDRINTIVVGTPENTGLTSTAWIITILHEHFHQYVYSKPGYYRAVDSLNLSGGDKTGMWMLNFPFPYTDSAAADKYTAYSHALSEVVSAIGTDSFESKVEAYAAKRRRFESALSPADYRYFSFQIWQEGIARYTEYKFLQALDGYQPSDELTQLSDYIGFREYREQFYKQQTTRISSWALPDHKRECFYAVGLGEGLVLDRLNPKWREKYLTERFFIERYSEKLK
jgi:hypothetical protein